MTILEQIVVDKRKEVAIKKAIVPMEQLEKQELFSREILSLSKRLKASCSGIIAEHKRRSPSKQVINYGLNVSDVAKGYEAAGVCGMSVLTDGKYFGGSLDDLLLARASCQLPLLRKEFIIDEYQILEAKAYGADVILLIATILSPQEIKLFSELAKSLHLEVLLEIHQWEELKKSMLSSIDMLGVNNRNLDTFEVSLNVSKVLSQHIPKEFIKVSESGIRNSKAVKELQSYGYKGFLIGENFMKTDHPGEAANAFIRTLDT